MDDPAEGPPTGPDTFLCLVPYQSADQDKSGPPRLLYTTKLAEAASQTGSQKRVSLVIAVVSFQRAARTSLPLK
jgi:hypothetical protein